MNRKRTQRAAQQANAVVEDAFSLPPAKKTPRGMGAPPRDPNAPSGSLSSDFDEVTPVEFSIPPRKE
jgi:hypothetical protein